MNTEKRNTFRILFFIRKTKLQKNGEAPIYLRITVNGRSMETMIKRTVSLNLWSQAKERSRGSDRKSTELNNYIESIRTRIYLIHKELSSDGQIIHLDTVRKKFYGIGDAKKTLVEIYQEHNDKCEQLIGKDFSKSTVDKFNTSLSHIKDYILFQYKTTDILLSDVDGSFIREFDFYLKTKKDCKQNTVVKHLKNLKKIIRIALSNDWIQKDPFMGIQFKHEETHVDFLTQEELNRLIRKEFEIVRLEQIRDVFVFCCYTGLAFADVKNLKEEHLIKDNQGKLWIRKKEKKQVSCSDMMCFIL